MSEYESVQRGALKLKGVKKKKKSKGKKKSSKVEKLAEEEPAIVSSLETTRDTRTEAEKRFARVQEERERARIEKAAKMTYRDQVEGFNKKLAAEPEHFDLPKVSHTK
ncbi:hypothetical protein NDN08_004698 [Rhodosorus marinus]|uniref:DUF1754-domain-containing protein n=1 Tax=Rhodosorus marinus TaxID=101924 RepID=A0AAV8UNI0_9RHOD|nr:hypothetical protein NDN08_004698 [Rhodosorus marinus]